MTKHLRTLLFVAPLSLASLGAVGCSGSAQVQAQAPSGEVVVQQAPPTEVVEAPPPPPSAEYVWIRGHHQWNGYRYVWVGGHYDRRPAGYATWVHGHWAARGGGWVWIEGHWN